MFFIKKAIFLFLILSITGCVSNNYLKVSPIHKMAITIDGKNYDETKLSEEVKSSIVQVSNLQSRQKNLTVEFDNTKVLINHHRDIITKGLTDEALVKDEKKEETKQ